MNISKIKVWLSSKPKWFKTVVIILCVSLLGLSAWLGFDSCASVDIDKFNVNTDKVQVDVEGVKVHPKEVSSVIDELNNSLDSIYASYDVDSLWSIKYTDMDNICISTFDMSYSELLAYANSIGLSYDGHYFITRKV